MASEPADFDRRRAPTVAGWAVLWCAVVAAEALALLPLVTAPGTVGPLSLVYRLVGGSFAACGLIAWHRRPDNRSGVLMTLTGFAFFVQPLLLQLDAAIPQTLGHWFADLWFLFFVPLLLTFVTGGRLRTRLDRALVGIVCAEVFVLAPLYLTVSPDVPTLLLITPHPGVAAVIDTAQRAAFAGVSLTTAAVLAARFHAASRPGRRALLPGLAGAACLLLYVTLLVLDIVIGPERTSPIAELLSWIAALSIVTVPLAFLAGLLRSRLARGGLAALFRELRAVQPADLQPALARALGDPSLVIAFPVGEGHFADADGTPIVLPDPDSRHSVASVEQDGVQVAALVYDRALDDDPELVDAVGAAATIALQNRALQAEALRSHAELRDSRGRIIAAADAERRRIERNLHDGAQQRLVSLALQLSLIQRRIRADPADAEQLVTAAGGELARSLEELRELARGIHPAALEHGLDVALEALAMRSAVPTVVSVDPGPRLPQSVEFAAYFVASEGLTNVAKYAQAGTAAITVARKPHRVVVQITDDGIGGADPALGTGLRGLDDRVQALGGQLRVTSPAGAGTVVTAELPTPS